MFDVPLRGEIWTADVLGDKRRPVLILTRSSFVRRLNNVTIAPVVSRVREIPTELVLTSSHGVDHRSAVSFDNILTIPQNQLIQRIGQLSVPELLVACEAIALALGCV